MISARSLNKDSTHVKCALESFVISQRRFSVFGFRFSGKESENR